MGGLPTTFGKNEIHTHDRITFKRCRRKWALSSHLRMNLVPASGYAEVDEKLWYGTGFHFALEDYHGYRRFASPADAFQAFYDACRPDERPSNAEELLETARKSLAYYEMWLRRRNEFETVWIDGKPQVEVHFQIPLPGGYVYAGTFDRIVRDPYDRWWVVEYKTAKKFDTAKLATDPQVTSYAWAAEQYYGREIEGFIYVQFLKKAPKPPRILSNGELSTNKNQDTTYELYRRTLIKLGIWDGKGSPPERYREILEYLAEQETPEGDAYIRRDIVRRNKYQKEAEYQKILLELQEMTNPDLPIYPNPTRDCAWDCPYRSLCIAMDDGSDWEYMLEQDFAPRKEVSDAWRQRIKWPE